MRTEQEVCQAPPSAFGSSPQRGEREGELMGVSRIACNLREQRQQAAGMR